MQKYMDYNEYAALKAAEYARWIVTDWADRIMAREPYQWEPVTPDESAYVLSLSRRDETPDMYDISNGLDYRVKNAFWAKDRDSRGKYRYLIALKLATMAGGLLSDPLTPYYRPPNVAARAIVRAYARGLLPCPYPQIKIG